PDVVAKPQRLAIIREAGWGDFSSNRRPLGFYLSMIFPKTGLHFLGSCSRGAKDGAAGADRGRVRLHHRWSGLGRLPAGQSAFRRLRQAGARARGGRKRQLDLVSYTGWLPIRYRRSAFGLVLQDRSRRGAQRQKPELSARQGDRRLVGDQRDDLYARPGRG